jgi:prepilin-type N-terminal cleavage/methylation domain-containing protein
MRTWKAGGCNNRGFTLVELAMVMLVLGIVAAITMPRVGGMLDRQNMRSTINVVRGTVRYLQARAALTKRTYRLTFDLDKQTMSACYLTEESCQEERSRVLRAYEFPHTVEVLDITSAAGEKNSRRRSKYAFLSVWRCRVELYPPEWFWHGTHVEDRIDNRSLKGCRSLKGIG